MRGDSIIAVGLAVTAVTLGRASALSTFGDAAGKGPVEDALAEWCVGSTEVVLLVILRVRLMHNASL